MKRLLATVGRIALLALMFIVALVAVVTVKGRALDRESKRYAHSAIVAIASHWNERALLERASPEFIKVCPAAGLLLFFDRAFSAPFRDLRVG